MVDITKMVAPKTDQLNADDFIGKKPFTVRMTSVKDTGSKEQPLAISFEGDNGKPYKPGLAMRRVFIQIWGDEVCVEANKFFPGRAVTLYRDPEVKFGSAVVGGIRVSHASHIDREIKCTMTVSRGKKVEFIVKPLKIEQAPAQDPIKALSAKILRAIRAEDNEAGLSDLIHIDHVDDLKKIKDYSESAHKYLMDEYKKRISEINPASHETGDEPEFKPFPLD